MRTHILALLGAAALMTPVAASAQGLNSMFNCNNPGNRQGSGAVVGGLLGGLLGNQINDNDRTTGTIVGGLLGAAAGSAIGCKMSSSDTTRATDATRRALNDNRSTTWSNGQTSGRIDIVDSFNRGDVSARAPDYDSRYDDRYARSLSDIRFARGVQTPVNYAMANGLYEARTRVNVRAMPSTRGRVLSYLGAGQTFDALATTPGGWVLAGRNGVAIGYVSTDVIVARGGGYDSYAYNNPSRDRRYSQGQVCRTFDQTLSQYGYAPTTERYTACQSPGGEWIIQS